MSNKQHVEGKTMKVEYVVNRHEYTSFWKSAFAVKGSVTPKVMKKVILAVLYSSLVSIMHYSGFSMAIPIGPFEYAGLIMGLLLVFRINAGYDRWWEARKLWGNVVNQSRNLAILIINYSHGNIARSRKKLLSYIAALPFLMKNNLRAEESIQELYKLVDKKTYDILLQAEHRPNLLSSMIAHELNLLRNNGALDSFAFLKAEELRIKTIDCQGACERIVKTPMPFVMAVKSRRFIFLFLLTLPLALVNTSLYINPVVTGLVAYALFSLDQIGIELQNPFSEKSLSHLPLDEVCKTIESNIVELDQSIVNASDVNRSFCDITASKANFDFV